jgi:hypothetical protein
MCEEYVRLLQAYRKAVARYSSTLDALEAARATVRKHEYQRMTGYVEQARLTSEQARTDLERHTLEHECIEPTHTTTGTLALGNGQG